MTSTAVLVIAFAIIASAGAGGVLVASNGASSQADSLSSAVSEFEICLEVLDAATNETIAGAYVEITDANGQVLASGFTNEDGEFEISAHNDSATDSDDETNETDDDCSDDDETNETHEQDLDDNEANETDDDCPDDDETNETYEQDTDDDETNDTSEDCSDDGETSDASEEDEDDIKASTQSEDCDDESNEIVISFDSVVGPLTVTVSMDGYVMQSITVDPTVSDDIDVEIFLEHTV
jgi:hypothetical protein